jgi:hypothetical protein
MPSYKLLKPMNKKQMHTALVLRRFNLFFVSNRCLWIYLFFLLSTLLVVFLLELTSAESMVCVLSIFRLFMLKSLC